MAVHEDSATFDPILTPRKGMPSPKLDEAEFRQRYLAQFVDPAFEPLRSQLEDITSVAWDAYKDSRKSPHTRRAGSRYTDPDYELSVDWIAAKQAIDEAHAHYERPDPCASHPDHQRVNAHTCPGEESRSYRMAKLAKATVEEKGGIDVLSLYRLAAEYGRHNHPCKACFSTSPALCH
jgi:hypothetical protein